MLILIAILAVALFICFFKDNVKKYSKFYYIGAILVTLLIFLLHFVNLPLYVNKYVVGIFSRGTMGTAFFIIVMYTGALPNKSRVTSTLMKIRGELSIIGAIIVISHNMTYGITYYRMLFTSVSQLSPAQRSAAAISVILLIIMLVLTITSFPSIRYKMNARKWKKLQRSAYVFYGLLYIHILLINIPYARLGNCEYIINTIIYSLIFITYAALRLRKFYLVKHKLLNGNAGGSLMKINIAFFLPALIIFLCIISLCFTGKDNQSDKNSITDIKTDSTDNHPDIAILDDGEYSGTAVCDVYGYTVTVTITVSDNIITSVNAVSDAKGEDVQYFNNANAVMPDKIINNQGVAGVDAVGGATKSSNAIKKAFYNAYKSAKNN